MRDCPYNNQHFPLGRKKERTEWKTWKDNRRITHHESRPPRYHGIMKRDSHGITASWIATPTVSWHHESRLPRYHGIMNRDSHGIMASWIATPTVMASWIATPTVSWHHESRLPRYHGTYKNDVNFPLFEQSPRYHKNKTQKNNIKFPLFNTPSSSMELCLSS